MFSRGVVKYNKLCFCCLALVGELVVYCEGPTNNALCALSDHTDGSMTLTMTAVDVGYHRLYVKYDDVQVPGALPLSSVLFVCMMVYLCYP